MSSTSRNESAAGGSPPAAIGSGEGNPAWQVVLWPHRSLSRRGFRIFLTILGGFFLFFGMMTFAPGRGIEWSLHLKVVAVVGGFMLAVFILVWALFNRNYRDARYHERIALFSDRLVIEALHPKRETKRWEFKPYWTTVRTRTTPRIENQLLLSSSGRVVAVGAFLTPEERAELAVEIEDALGRVA